MPDLRPEDLSKFATSSRVVPIEVPEWGGTVYLASPSSARRDAAEAATWKDGVQDLTNFRARLVALCLAFPDGRPWFEDPAAGVEEIGRCDSRVVRRLFAQSKKLCPVSEADIEGLEKN